MSTIVVARKNGQVSVAADTLTTFGSLRESAELIRNPTKILTVGDSFLAVAGHASLDLVLRSYFDGLDELPTFDSPQAIFEAAREMHRVLKDDYFLKPEGDEDDEFESSQYEILIANAHGIFGLYALRSVQEYTKFYASGSGYRFALGAMWAAYDRLETSEEIARLGASAGAFFDTSSGPPVEVKTVPLRAAPLPAEP